MSCNRAVCEMQDANCNTTCLEEQTLGGTMLSLTPYSLWQKPPGSDRSHLVMVAMIIGLSWALGARAHKHRWAVKTREFACNILTVILMKAFSSNN